MIINKGKSVCDGIAIGKIFIYKKSDNTVTRTVVADAQAELQRFESAKAEAVSQLQKLYEKGLVTLNK